jgi:hypothetical protein
MQSFRRRTVRIRTVGDKISDSSQALSIARSKTRVLVYNKSVVIIWTKCEVDVRPYSWRDLVCDADILNRLEYEKRPNTHRHVHPEVSIDERGFSGASLIKSSMDLSGSQLSAANIYLPHYEDPKSMDS